MLTNVNLKSPLAHSIVKEYNKLISLIKTISPEQRILKSIEGPGGMVSVSDLIAYQIGWGRLLISWYESGLKNERPQMPGEGFHKWDYAGLARVFYEKYTFDSGFNQEQEFENIVRKIILVTENEYARNYLDAVGVWKWCTLASGKEWPLSKWITVNSVSPYKRAYGLIKNSLTD